MLRVPVFLCPCPVGYFQGTLFRIDSAEPSFHQHMRSVWYDLRLGDAFREKSPKSCVDVAVVMRALARCDEKYSDAMASIGL
jgi:hypothetical protein